MNWFSNSDKKYHLLSCYGEKKE